MTFERRCGSSRGGSTGVRACGSAGVLVGLRTPALDAAAARLDEQGAAARAKRVLATYVLTRGQLCEQAR